MRLTKVIIVIGLFLSIIEANNISPKENSSSVIWTIAKKKLPLPSCASKELLNILSKVKQSNVETLKKFAPKSKKEWRDWIAYSKSSGTDVVKDFAKKYNVNIEKKVVEGIDTYHLTPASIDPKNSKKVFIYLHGGAYIFGGGISGLTEAVLIASRVQMPVVAIDYRMPPDYPFPTAIEDVVKVYSSLIKSYSTKSIAMGGSSSGGGLTLATIHKLKELNMALPSALFVGTPWADLNKNGDSLFVNEGIDRKIVTYDGFVTAAAKLYANGTDFKNPGLSPIYGDFSNFPPTMLVTGTRDLFLSFTVRVHRKMRASGVEADLNVYEGLSHVEYFVIPDAPESIDTYKELGNFLDKHLEP